MHNENQVVYRVLCTQRLQWTVHCAMGMGCRFGGSCIVLVLFVGGCRTMNEDGIVGSIRGRARFGLFVGFCRLCIAWCQPVCGVCCQPIMHVHYLL